MRLNISIWLFSLIILLFFLVSLRGVDDSDGFSDVPEGPRSTSALRLTTEPPMVEKDDVLEPTATQKPRAVASIKDTREFFDDVLLIVMMSPSRFHLVDTVKRHYAPFFQHMYFCGPKTNLSFETPIHGYNIVYGNEQYRAVREIIRQYEGWKPANNRDDDESNETSIPPIIPSLKGYLYVADDLMIHPWMLTTRDKSKIWATQMGIGNLRSGRPVWAVPGMSMQSKYRLSWPYWPKNRRKMMGVLNDPTWGPTLRQGLQKAAKKTNHHIFRWSKYPSAFRGDDQYQWVMFYTIVDTYYVPRRLAKEVTEVFHVMAKNWIFGECAIATTLRALDETYEEMQIQFYWSSLKATDCHRHRWALGIDGFHRCIHSHPFAEAMYDGDERTKMQQNKSHVRALLKL